MTNDKIIEALQACGDSIHARASSPTTRLQSYRNQDARGHYDRLAHLLWMVDEAITFVEQSRHDKAFRWLGFIQGAMWALGVMSIEDAKRINKPADAVFDKERV